MCLEESVFSFMVILWKAWDPVVPLTTRVKSDVLHFSHVSCHLHRLICRLCSSCVSPSSPWCFRSACSTWSRTACSPRAYRPQTPVGPPFSSTLNEKVIKRNKPWVVILVLVHRHHAGTLLFCPVAAAHSRTDNWRLPVCELRPSLHRNRSVRDECRRVHLPAAVSPKKHWRAKGMTSGRWSPSSVGDGGHVNHRCAAGTATIWRFRTEHQQEAHPVVSGDTSGIQVCSMPARVYSLQPRCWNTGQISTTTTWTMNLYFCTLIIKTSVGIWCAYSELDMIE